MNHSTKSTVLKKSLIFSNLSEDELTELSTIVSEYSLNSEQYLFWEGDRADYFYIVAQGKVKVFKHATTGKEFIIAFFNPGEMFGEVAAFEKKPYPASAQAVSASVVFRIQREDFISFLNKHPQVVLRIIGILSERLRVAQSRLRDLAAERVEQRLAGILLMLTTKLGPILPFTRQEIADMTGTTIETAIRVISQLKDRRIIKSSRGQIEIIDEPNLRRLTEDSQ